MKEQAHEQWSLIKWYQLHAPCLAYWANIHSRFDLSWIISMFDLHDIIWSHNSVICNHKSYQQKLKASRVYLASILCESIKLIRRALNQFSLVDVSVGGPITKARSWFFVFLFTSPIDRKAKNAKHSINTALISSTLLFMMFQSSFISCLDECEREWDINDEEVVIICRIWHFSSFFTKVTSLMDSHPSKQKFLNKSTARKIYQGRWNKLFGCLSNKILLKGLSDGPLNLDYATNNSVKKKIKNALGLHRWLIEAFMSLKAWVAIA